MKIKLSNLIVLKLFLAMAVVFGTLFAAGTAQAMTVAESPFNEAPVLHISDKASWSKPFPAITPRAYLVADLNSGQILAEKNSQIKLPIASVTKMMTAVVAVERVDLQRSLVIQNSMLAPYGYSRYVPLGKRMSLAQLLYPMLVESSNDAAQAASCFLGNRQTIKLMNETAQSLSMQSTSFADVHGLSPKNVSTVRDLFYLARYVAKNHPDFLEMTRGAAGDSGSRAFSGMKNKNLVYEMENFIGGKTGYIPESKYNGMFVFNFLQADGSEKKVAIIILGAPRLSSGTQNLKQEVALTLGWIKSEQGFQSRLAAIFR